MHRTTRILLAGVVISVGFSYGAQRPTAATPTLMKKEGLTQCGYCHVKPGGGGPRNYRGLFFAAHGHTFAGFDDAAEAKTAGVDVGPDANEKPLSLTPPAPAAPAEPAKPMTMAKSGSALSADKAHAAKLAYQKNPKDAKLKAAYVSSLAGLSHAYLGEKRYADTQTVAKTTLALDPKNAGAKSDLAAAIKAGKK